MANKVFIDTNILFDVIDVTRQNSDCVRRMFELSENKDLSFFVSAITINNILYVLQNRFKMKSSDLKERLKKLFLLVEIVPYDMEVIIDGLRLDFDDIEDSFQFVSALKCGAYYLITEDKKLLDMELKNDKIQLMRTQDFLNSF